MEEYFTRVWNDLGARFTGPFSLRLVLQPTMATIFAIRDGLKDAKTGRPPYFYSLFTDAAQRRSMLREGWHAVAKVFIFAIVLDTLFQLIVFKWVYPVEVVLVAFLLAFNPYLVLRGPVNRIARSFARRSVQKVPVYILGALCLLPVVQSVNGQTPQQPAANQPSQHPDDNLAAQVVDPTAALKTITFQTRFSPSLWGIDDEQNEVDMQLGIPHSAFQRRNILRITIPYATSAPDGRRGLTDVSVFNILLFPKKWATIAAGGVASVRTHKGPGVDTFAAGPAVGLVSKKGKWTYGVFSQNLFSFGDVATTQLQPILAYTLNRKISFALGDLQHTYDWKKDRFVNVPLGFQVNYIANLGEQPVRLFINPQYNVKNEFGTRKWTVTSGVALIVR